MATVQISLDEYLRSSYHPDCDYVDGEVQERNLGEFDHAAVQMFLGNWFFQHREDWQLHVLPEMRIRVSATRVRIADICLMARSQVVEQVPTKPPLAVIEILSPEDRISRYAQRLADYRQMGIPNVWVIDPANRIGYDCSTAAWLPVEEFRVEGTAIFARLSDLWSELEANR
ncbi:MAG: Uma2 family endonuclease [Candidatus Korobacteraceae bacterium]